MDQDELQRSKKAVFCDSIGLTNEFPVKVGIQKGSVLSLLLFIAVLDVITSDIRKAAPWNLLYTDDVILVVSAMQALENTSAEGKSG